MSTLCKARLCTKHIEPQLLMCEYHWRLVPEFYKTKIQEKYTPGQEQNHRLIKKEYLYYCDKARNIVSYKEHVQNVKTQGVINA